MTDDVLANNPHIRVADLEALHAGAWQWCYSLAGNEADDVLQQVYVMLIEGKARFRGESTLKTWLYAVIRRAALKDRRRRKRWLGLEEAQLDTAAIELSDTVAITPYLSKLPAKQREVLELSIYREFTLAECAHIMGVRLGTARTHYHRGKAALRALLTQQQQDKRLPDEVD